MPATIAHIEDFIQHHFKRSIRCVSLYAIPFMSMLASCGTSTSDFARGKFSSNRGNDELELYPFIYCVDEAGKRIEFSDDCKKGYRTLDNEIAVAPVFEEADAFHEGLAAVKLKGLWGFLDEDGKLAIKCQFDSVMMFRNGTAYFRSDSRWGKIDTNGNVVIPNQYLFPYEFDEGLALAESSGMFGYVDTTGKWKLPPIYEQATKFVGGLACVKLNGSWNWIDLKGSIAFSLASYSKSYLPVFNYIRYQGERIIFNEEDTVFCFLDRQGKIIQSGHGRIDNYNYIGRLRNFNAGLVPVTYNGLVGFVDTSGNLKINFRYLNAWSFVDGMARVQLATSKYGFINERDSVIIPFIYDEAIDASYGIIIAMKGSLWGAIDTRGQVVIPFVHQQWYPNFGEPFYQFQLGDSVVSYNNKGKKVPPLYYIGNIGQYGLKQTLSSPNASAKARSITVITPAKQLKM